MRFNYFGSFGATFPSTRPPAVCKHQLPCGTMTQSRRRSLLWISKPLSEPRGYKLPDYISHNPPRCRPIGADVCLEDAVGRRIICPLCASHFREREWEREMRNAHWRRVRQDTGSDRGERKTEESQKGIIVGFVYLFIFTYTISLKRIRSKVGLWLWEGEKVSSGHDLVKNKHSVSSTLSYTHTVFCTPYTSLA